MYLVLKTTEEQVVKCGSLFEAVRGHWVLDPYRAMSCSHVIAVINKKIKGVFSIDKWYSSTLCAGRYVFAGELDATLYPQLINKDINPALTIRGAENPVRYVEEGALL